MEIRNNARTFTTAYTHGGVFHGDEVTATAILRRVFPGIQVSRVFKLPEVMPENSIAYDIGWGEFDHHQRGGNGGRKNGVPYSAAGLIWREFGPRICASTADPEAVWEAVDKALIQGVDAQDCGTLPQLEYPATPQTFSGCISGFNPAWNSSEKPDDCFWKAVEFATQVLDNAIAFAASKAEAKEIVEEAISGAEEGVMVMERFAPWTEHLLVSTNPKAETVKLVVFPSNREGYNWQGVPIALGSRQNRANVPDSWKGLNGKALQDVTGVATANFCHPAGFIGGALTLEDTIAMARKALAEANS